jgi:hypothetical protein
MEEYMGEIKAVKAAIIAQKVPTKYAGGLAALVVLAAAYNGGDVLALGILERSANNDRELVNEFRKMAGLKPVKKGQRISRIDIDNITRALAQKYQVFRAVDVAATRGTSIIDTLKEVE